MNNTSSKNHLESSEEFRFVESKGTDLVSNFVRELFETESGRNALISRFGFTGGAESYLRLNVVQGNLENAVQLVVEKDGKVIGWGEIIVDKSDDSIAFISRIISPEFQGKGLGTLLAQNLIKLTKQKFPKIKKIISETYTTAAVHSLTKFGFKHSWRNTGSSQMQSVMELDL